MNNVTADVVEHNGEKTHSNLQCAAPGRECDCDCEYSSQLEHCDFVHACCLDGNVHTAARDEKQDNCCASRLR